jgi:hypothetical protein
MEGGAWLVRVRVRVRVREACCIGFSVTGYAQLSPIVHIHVVNVHALFIVPWKWVAVAV